MKKLILSLAVLFSLQMVTAQISFNPKISKGQGVATNFQIVSKSTFTNNSNDTSFEWNVIEIAATNGWSFGMCDPANCVTDLLIGTKGNFVIAKGKSGEFIGDFVPDGKPGNGKAKVLVYSKANPNTIYDTIEFQMNAWATGIKENQSSREFSFYPNPAKDRLTIKYNTKETITIDIYNVLGSKIKSISHSGLESDINIGDMQNGIYFIRFKDGNQTISKPFSKSE